MSETTAVVVQDDRPLSAAGHRAQVNLIQEVMREVMKENEHYGRVPGTQKPSLWKPGAEKLSMTFRIAINPVIDADLSTDDVRRYRIRADATSQISGAFLGAAFGTCSSNEEKYKWRGAVCEQEWEETPIDRRRNKWRNGQEGAYCIKQIRTEPDDIDNTVLKMAVKRAVVAVILQVTAASDIFTQDIEDLPEEVRGEMASEGERPKAEPSQQRRSNVETISEPQRGRCFAIGKSKGWSLDQYRALIKKHGFDSDKDIPKAPKSIYENICAELEKGPAASNGSAA